MASLQRDLQNSTLIHCIHQIKYQKAFKRNSGVCLTVHQNHPGQLSLCIGMNVMIIHNQATECCVTNGAEATAVGQKSHVISEDKETLDTLFIKLTNPPKNIQLDGWPENVVPISKHTISVPCD
jgi:hypothetical protein